MVEPSLVLYGAPYERAVEVLEETLRETGARSVSYTHLTLPTIYSV